MSQEFYEVEVQSIDWFPILARMVDKFDKTGAAVHVHVDTSGDIVLYHIDRKIVPVEAMAQALGVTPEAVASAPKLILRPFKAMADWQKPTVPYYGVA